MPIPTIPDRQKLLHMAGTTENGCKWLKMSINGKNGWNGSAWLYMAVNVWKG